MLKLTSRSPFLLLSCRSDPHHKPGRRDSPRGAGIAFGPEVTAAFLAQNQLRLIIRSHECVQKGFEMHHNDSLLTVFSASNYCGTVNNEGAFIIFERDLIPRIVPFYAKPKERLSRYRMRHAVMQNDVIAKLLQRIADNRLALTNYYRSVGSVTPSGVHTVTRTQWAEGLKTVLQLNIPFGEFQDYLGLPKLGVDGRKKGDVDYQTFLLRFRPINALLDPNKHGPGSRPASPSGTSPPSRSRSINENVDAILEMLQKNRYELESLFRHFGQAQTGTCVRENELCAPCLCALCSRVLFCLIRFAQISTATSPSPCPSSRKESPLSNPSSVSNSVTATWTI